MKYIDEFRNKKLIHKIADKIKDIVPRYNINIMEVCGTHTHNFYRFGLDKLLPDNLKFISGPGCPVCVSSQEYIDKAIYLAASRDVIITTFGDMMRVPGTVSNLEKERAKTGNVRVVYSALDALSIARKNPERKVIFLAVGFETTAPTIAQSILLAQKQNLKNIFFYSSLKLIPAAMDYLLQDKRLRISAFLCPGHVSVVIGTKPYEFIQKRYKIGCCVAGFEPLDILEGIYLLTRQVIKNKPCLQNQYARAVTGNGNLKAKKIIAQVFKVTVADWRGLGRVPRSGLEIRKEFASFDAQKQFLGEYQPGVISHQPQKCRCAEVLKGLISPPGCSLFKKGCSPENPIGPCMVSGEGACNAYYKYK